MEPLAYIRRSLVGALGTLIGLYALVVAANADEVATAARPAPVTPGIRIHDASETLANYCRTDAEGRIWFTIPGGASYELITSTDDPAIVNKGDGDFFAFDEFEIRSAMAEVSYPLDRVVAEVFVLPYPRRSGLESAAGPGLILLSPGVRKLSAEHQHAEFVHELGHIVQYAHMPDVDRDRWSTYRNLRGIADEYVYSSDGSHGDRPHEIFAEDFRALFGGSRANYSGTIENAAIQHPTTVQGLREFMLALANGVTIGLPLQAFPNPSRGAVTFTRVGSDASMLDLFDTQGRRIASVEPADGFQGVQWTWDGTDFTGRRVEPGVFFARTRDPKSRTVRVAVTP